MSNVKGIQKVLEGKLKITGTITVVTGLHIGADDDFAPIGAVDSPFVRDVLNRTPIIPGSSLKGKIRTLLACKKSPNYCLEEIEKDVDVIKRLFGSHKTDVVVGRLQFFDLFINSDSEKKFANLDTDTYIGEVKFENTINRLTAVAKPRQIERVPAGVVFDFNLVYNVEKVEGKETEIELREDMQVLREGLKLLQNDYLGGHGTRGYGRVKFSALNVEAIGCNEKYAQDSEKILNSEEK